MSLRNALLLLCCLLVTCLQAWSGDGKEQAKLEGTWSFVKAAAGDKAKEDERGPVQMIFAGDKVTFAAEGKKPVVQGTYKVDPSKKPKTMDITLERDGKTTTMLAIYDLDGDTFKICHYLGAKGFKQRPKEFVADAQTVLGILKRQ